jgi:hypothetical protein
LPCYGRNSLQLTAKKTERGYGKWAAPTLQQDQFGELSELQHKPDDVQVYCVKPCTDSDSYSDYTRSSITSRCTLYSKGFWRWCTTLRITRFLDSVHRPVF